MTMKAFLEGTDVFTFLLADLSKRLIYQVVLLVIWFVDLIGQSQSATAGITCKVFFQNAFPFPNGFQWSYSQIALLN